jgi:hypothetical protein
MQVACAGKATQGKTQMLDGRFLRLSLEDSSRALPCVAFKAFENVGYVDSTKNLVSMSVIENTHKTCTMLKDREEGIITSKDERVLCRCL